MSLRICNRYVCEAADSSLRTILSVEVEKNVFLMKRSVHLRELQVGGRDSGLTHTCVCVWLWRLFCLKTEDFHNLITSNQTSVLVLQRYYQKLNTTQSRNVCRAHRLLLTSNQKESSSLSPYLIKNFKY